MTPQRAIEGHGNMSFRVNITKYRLRAGLAMWYKMAVKGTETLLLQETAILLNMILRTTA